MSLHFTRLGSGPALFLLHATLSTSRQLRALAASLARHHTVIAVDRRGSGGSTSEGPAAPIDVAVHVADLASLAQSQRGKRPQAGAQLSLLENDSMAAPPTRPPGYQNTI